MEKSRSLVWRVEVRRVLYVVADSAHEAEMVAEEEMQHRNEAEETYGARLATASLARRDGWLRVEAYRGGDRVVEDLLRERALESLSGGRS